jgi:hypothetical protein
VAAQRSSASKRQRDFDKRSRAAEKRDRRQRKGDPSDDPSALDADAIATPPADSGAILEQMEQLQQEYDAEIIDFETYDARKAELLSHIQI